MTEFTLPSYKHMLSTFMDMGYEFTDYSHVDAMKKQVVLRHDVDFSPAYALTIAQVENELGISATYFFLVRSTFYNILSPEVERIVREIRDLGHAIGLHFDAALYPDDRAKAEAAAERECQILAQVAGSEIESISFHRPASHLVGLAGLFAGRLHTYDPKYVKEIGYCSDSRGEWRFGPPFETDAVREGRALHLLTHPIWWFSPERQSPVERVRRFLRELDRKLGEEAANNCIPFAQWFERERAVTNEQ